jgi:hypothetical protein
MKPCFGMPIQIEQKTNASIISSAFYSSKKAFSVINLYSRLLSIAQNTAKEVS